MTDTKEPLTEEQLENWRRILSNPFGSYARVMSDARIHELRDELQEVADSLVVEDDEV